MCLVCQGPEPVHAAWLPALGAGLSLASFYLRHWSGLTYSAKSASRVVASLVLTSLLVVVFTPGSTAQAVQSGPADEPIITDSRLRNNEGFLEEQIQKFLDGQPGPLKSYRELLYAGTSQSAARTIAAFCLTAEVNPKVVLALIELKSRLISNQEAPPGLIEVALGFDGPEQRGFRKQITFLSGHLSDRWSFYDAKSTLQFKDGSTRSLNPRINRGTYAIQAVLALVAGQADWQRQVGRGADSFYDIYKRFWGDPLQPEPAPALSAALSVKPFLARPFYETDISTNGLVSGLGRRDSPGVIYASDNLNYNSPADYGVNTYFDHQYPSFISGLPGGNPPDNEFPGIVVAYRGRTSPASIGWERAYSGHDAIDFDVGAGKPILAAASGRVVNADWGGCGKVVIIDHRNEYRTLYLHLADDLSVGVGDEVKQGQVLGRVGLLSCTGPHLHFGVTRNFQAVDPFGFCPDSVGSDPWELKSGAKSFWLWRDIDSPCVQQNGSPADYATHARRQDFASLVQGRSGVPTPTPAVTAGPVAPPAPRPASITPVPINSPAFPGPCEEVVIISGKVPDGKPEDYLALLNDPDSLIRRYALQNLVKLRSAEAITPITALLADADSGVRWNAARSLYQLGAGQQLIAAYLKLSQHEVAEMRFYAAEGLGHCRARLAIPRLISLLEDSSKLVRWQSVQALQDLRATEALAALRARLSDPEPEVQAIAAETLLVLQDKT